VRVGTMRTGASVAAHAWWSVAGLTKTQNTKTQSPPQKLKNQKNRIQNSSVFRFMCCTGLHIAGCVLNHGIRLLLGHINTCAAVVCICHINLPVIFAITSNTPPPQHGSLQHFHGIKHAGKSSKHFCPT